MPTVILLEDSVDDIDLFRRVWKSMAASIDLIVAQDGREAAAILSGVTRRNDLALVVLDIKVPYSSGLKVLRHLRSCDNIKDVPAVIFSSSDQRDDIEEAFAGGANAYVRKPIDYDEYKEAVRSILVYWTKLNIPPKSV